MSMIDDINNVQDRVKFILEKYPECRDSDKLLWLAYCCHYNNLKEVVATGRYTNFKDWLMREEIPSFESLSRTRRKMQEDQEELAGNKKVRLKEESKVRKHFAKKEV